MDHIGDLALGFSASSATINPQIRYAGRLVTDPVNTLAQGEATLFAGTGSQSGTSNRWGDYSDMTIDPVDDCTFWFTSEYYPSGVSQFNWRTRIGSFSFPSCGGGGPTTGSIAGTVTDASTSSPIAGATVAINGGASTTTSASGAYTLSNLAPASYSLTASKTGYVSATNNGVVVTAGNSTPSNFALNPVPPTTGSITGHVTDNVTHTAISGATVALSTGPSTTTDASGAYTFGSLSPASYNVTASKTGYVSATNNGVVVTAGNPTTSDFALTPNPSTTTPFAYATTSVAGSGGDGNGYETNRSGLWGAPNGLFATDVNSGKRGGGASCTGGGEDKEIASGYSLSGVSGNVLGIQVQLTGLVSSTSGSPRYCVQLSSDGGSTWTAAKQTAVIATSTTTFVLGDSADTWGRSWTPANFGSTFRVRITDMASSNSLTFSLDSVGVSVTYQ